MSTNEIHSLEEENSIMIKIKMRERKVSKDIIKLIAFMLLSYSQMYLTKIEFSLKLYLVKLL